MENKLFMVLLGCTPEGRNIEQHDIFFGIGSSLKDLKPQMLAFWPESKGKLHIDSWREVTSVDGFTVTVAPEKVPSNDGKLFFINLGGYKVNDPEEYHYKILTVADSISEASKNAKQNAFFKHYNLPGGGAAHIDDKFGIDIDDIHNVNDILPGNIRNRYSIKISKNGTAADDKLHVGYIRLNQL